MPFEYDGTGVPVDGMTIPEEVYTLAITKAKEGKSKQGDYQVTCDLVVCGGQHDKFPVTFHRVTFKNPATDPKGAGMALKWLKCIGQPWEGKFNVVPSKWAGKFVKAFLAVDEYNGKKSMKIKWFEATEAPAGGVPDIEEVPF